MLKPFGRLEWEIGITDVNFAQAMDDENGYSLVLVKLGACILMAGFT